MYISTDIGIGIDHFCNALELCAMGDRCGCSLNAQGSKAQRIGERDVPWNRFVVLS